MKKVVLFSLLALALGVAALELLPFLALDTETDASGANPSSPAVVVASANFPENELVAEIYAGALAHAGVKTDTALNLGSREVLFPSLANGDVTVVPEYTGALLDYLSRGEAEPTSTAEEQLIQLASVLPDGLRLLQPSAAQDKETVTCNADVAERYSLRSLEDLGPVSEELIMGGPPELARRAGRYSLAGLEKVYGIDFKEFRPLDVAGPLTVAALREKKIDCANLFSTQSAIVENGFVVLSDPKGLIESQAVVPLISETVASPVVVETLNAVSEELTTANLREMVEKVEAEKLDARDVASDFLSQHNLG